ncbi:MAG: hypothetical protein ACK5D5_06680 [Bacteroidota bacterium]|jgi:hypothetical protein
MAIKTKLILFIVVFITTGLSCFSQAKQEVVNNQTVIKLVKSKVGDDVIIKKINSSNCDFNVGTDDLITLKENNVSEKIINLMVEKQAKTDSEAAKGKSKNSDGKNNVFTESGIFFKQEGKYVPLDATLVTSNNSKNMGCMGGCLSIYGFGKFFSNKLKSQIEGNEANYQFNQMPEFYFNFEKTNRGLNNANNNSLMDEYFQNVKASSPNEFKLVKLDVSKGKREYVSAKVKGNGEADNSIDDNYIVNFKYSKVSENTYKVTFPTPLTPGEYCFVYLANNENPNPYLVNTKGGNRVFDFGIK